MTDFAIAEWSQSCCQGSSYFVHWGKHVLSRHILFKVWTG